MDHIIFLIVIIVVASFSLKAARKLWAKYAIYLIEKCETYPSEQAYLFAKDVMKKMNLDCNLIMGIQSKAKDMNAMVTCERNNIIILFRGNWGEEEIKFVICHELGHIKAKHNKEGSGILFYTELLFIVALAYQVFIYVNPSFIINYNEFVTQNIFYSILLLVFALGVYINYFTLPKRSHIKEYEADLIAAKIVGIDISIKAIKKLNDKTVGLSSHPTNDERIKYISKNI